MHGFPKAKFKGFSTLQEAQRFIGIFEKAGGNTPEPKHAGPEKRAAEEAPEQKQPVAKRPRVQNPKAEHVSSNWKVLIGFDGGARGNPGIAGAGAEVVITERTSKNVQKARRKIHLRKFVGTSSTSNLAEWQGVLNGLLQVVDQVEKFQETNEYIQPQIELFVQGDSQLVIRQLDGTYQCKNPGLRKLKNEFDAALEKLKALTNGSLAISYEHVYRIDNKVADGKFGLVSHILLSPACILLTNLNAPIPITS